MSRSMCPSQSMSPSAPWNQEAGPCEVCGQFEDDCVCPECPVCGGFGDPYCYSDVDPNGTPVDRTRNRGSYGTASHGLLRSFAQVALYVESERLVNEENERINAGYIEYMAELDAIEAEGIPSHPFVATPNNGTCSSCGKLRSASVHHLEGWNDR